MKPVANVSTAMSNTQMEHALLVQHLSNKMQWKGSCSYFLINVFFISWKHTTYVQKRVKLKG